MSPQSRRWLALVVSLTLVALAALAPAPVHPAAAAGGGTFTVDTANDSNTPGDSELSLREALEIANGTLLGPFSAAERAQMANCTFDAGHNIGNDCGGGNNLIKFTPTLTEARLTAALPTITAGGITVDGAVNSGQVVIDGQALADDAFDVSASHFTLENAALINLTGYPVNSNAAIKGLVLANDNLGVPPGALSCSDPRIIQRVFTPVYLRLGAGTDAAGDGTAYLTGNVIGCSAHEAIVLSDIANVYVGLAKNGAPGRNWIGTDLSGHDLGSVEWGIDMCCSAAVHDNQVLGNVIAHNAWDGIELALGTTNTISGNVIAHSGWNGIDLSQSTANTLSVNELASNGGAGVKVEDSRLTALTDNDIHDNLSSGIWLTGTQTVTTTISGGAVHGNGAAGLTEGNGATNNTWHNLSTYNNGGLGIDKYNNGLPDATGALSVTNFITTSQGLSVTGRFSGLYFPSWFAYQVEVYALAPDPSGYGEGQRYIGTTFVQPGLPKPTWSVLDPSRAGCYTAVLTLNGLSTLTGHNDSYEFAANFGACRYYQRLPLVQR
jgi:parallel beta-helix repeat protein